MAEDLYSLAKALENSETLELDSTKTKIKRRVPYVPVDQNEINRRTVYVVCFKHQRIFNFLIKPLFIFKNQENLPADVNHDLLKRIFGRCGKVCYISLPRYKTTKEIKGFAFIEFDSKQSAKNAIKVTIKQL